MGLPQEAYIYARVRNNYPEKDHMTTITAPYDMKTKKPMLKNGPFKVESDV